MVLINKNVFFYKCKCKEKRENNEWIIEFLEYILFFKKIEFLEV